MVVLPFNFLHTSVVSAVTEDFHEWLTGKEIVRLNIGAGSDVREPRNEWVNIDGLPLPTVDVVADVSDLKMFPDECADTIESNHCIEHVSYLNSLQVLQDWMRLLKPGGNLILRCPDAGVMFKKYCEGTWRLGPPGTERNVMNVLWGNLEDPVYGLHRAGFDKPLMHHYLKQCGMCDIVFSEMSSRGHEFEMEVFAKKMDL